MLLEFLKQSSTIPVVFCFSLKFKKHGKIWYNKSLIKAIKIREQLHMWNREQEKEIFRGETAATAAKSLQSCPTLCDPIDGSPPGSSVPGILQARTLEWVAISFSNA